MPPSPKVVATYIGTATLLLEIGDAKPIRILTDPALDPGGRAYKFPFFTGSRKTLDPAWSAERIGPLDLILLSHDQHADNLDDAGRALLPRAKKVITTQGACQRLRPALGNTCQGLKPWDSVEVDTPEGWRLKIHAVPAKHGQWPLPEWVVGQTLGFVVEWPGQTDGALYLSGDTVYFSGIPEIGRRFKIDTAVLNLGCVKFGISGPLRYTFDGHDAARAVSALHPRTVIPLHFDGWTHFQETLESSLAHLRQAEPSAQIRVLPPGQPVTL